MSSYFDCHIRPESVIVLHYDTVRPVSQVSCPLLHNLVRKRLRVPFFTTEDRGLLGNVNSQVFCLPSVQALHRQTDITAISTVKWCVVQRHLRSSKLVPIESRMLFPINLPLQLWARLLSVPLYNDLSVENLHFRRFTQLSWFETVATRVPLGPMVWKLVVKTRICMILRLFVLTQYQRVTDRRTDRRIHCLSL